MQQGKLRNFSGQLSRFAMATGVSAALSLGLPVALHELVGVEERVAVAIGFFAAFSANAYIVPRLVFRSEDTWQRTTGIYLLTSAFFRIMEYLLFLFLFQMMSVDYMLSVIIVLALSSISKFFLYRFVYTPCADTP